MFPEFVARRTHRSVIRAVQNRLPSQQISE